MLGQANSRIQPEAERRSQTGAKMRGHAPKRNFAGWLKPLSPPGISGRVHLILFFPIAMILLAVAIMFVQRHFDRVTRQLVASFQPKLELVLMTINTAPDIEAAANDIGHVTDVFGLSVWFANSEQTNVEDHSVWFDLTGTIAIDVLHRIEPAIVGVDLEPGPGSQPILAVLTRHGIALIQVPRSALTPSNPQQFLILIIFAALLTTVISLLFLRNQLRPIRRLSNAVEAFSRGRDIDLPITGAREIRSAATAFVEMRKRIRQQEQERTTVFANISHDLKTPLARVRLGLELLEKSPERKALVKDIQLMDKMISEVLEYTRHGKIGDIGELKPIEVVRTIVGDAQAAGQAVELRISPGYPDDVTVVWHQLALRRALDNLILNARKHASRAILTVQIVDQFHVFCVEDDGEGIDEADRRRAIEPNVRLDKARNLNLSEGSGLGLAIVNQIATTHGGGLDLGESEELGGLKATIRLSTNALVGLEGFEPPTKAL